jgi:hypothetical protein
LLVVEKVVDDLGAELDGIQGHGALRGRKQEGAKTRRWGGSKITDYDLVAFAGAAFEVLRWCGGAAVRRFELAPVLHHYLEEEPRVEERFDDGTRHLEPPAVVVVLEALACAFGNDLPEPLVELALGARVPALVADKRGDGVATDRTAST